MSLLPRPPLALGLVAAVGVAVAVALATVGGPGTARLETLDQRRAGDLAELVEAIERHRLFAGRLPHSLGSLRAGPSGPPPTRDPGTGASYAYEVLGEAAFRVCAPLSSPGSALPVAAAPRAARPPRFVRVVPDPAAGRLCWEAGRPPG